MPDTSAPRRSESFWFEDGDIVLSVTESGVEYHFRIHRFILAISSPIFRNMFLMPQPSGSESLPVSLQGDSVQEVTALLGALYVGQIVQKPTFDVTLGILRLSHKYQIQGLRESMKLKLLEDWPVKLPEYIARLTFLGSPEYRIQQAVKLIETAEPCQAYELLPAAFYELTGAWGKKWRSIAKDLSPENSKRLFVGRARIEERLRSFVDAPWKATSPTTIIKPRSSFLICENVDIDRRNNSRDTVCNSLLPSFRTIFVERFFGGASGVTILQQFERKHLGESVCRYCKDWFMKVLESKVDELWESIPADFDLPKIGS